MGFRCSRLIYTISTLLKDHYQTLGVTEKATKAEIKTAYYKLSMLYHPDRNQGCKNAAKQFQAISNAYEVLSDYRKRKLYDKGLFVDKKTGTDDDQHQQMKTSFYKQRPVTTRKSPIYNFDEWSKAHYGDSFQRRAQMKEEYELNKKCEETIKDHTRNTNVIFAIVAFLTVVVMFSYTFEHSLDKPSRQPVKEKCLVDNHKTKSSDIHVQNDIKSPVHNMQEKK